MVKTFFRRGCLCVCAIALPALIDNDGAARAFGQEELPSEAAVRSDAPQVVVSEVGTVELHVADLPLSTVLRLLSLEGQRNIIASPKVTGTVTADLYGVTFDEALNAILMSNGAGYRKIGNFIYVHTEQELREMADLAGGRPVIHIFKLSYISAEDARTYVGAVLDEEDGAVFTSPMPAGGLASSASEGGGNAFAEQDFIIVKASPAKIREIADLLAEVDVRPRQVLVEATILRAKLSDDNALGIDFTLVGGVDLSLLGATSQGVTSLTLGSLPQDRFEKFNAAATTDFAGNVPGGGLTIGILKDHVAVFVRALEEITDTVVVANPKVLALNKQKAQVIVGRRDGYLTTTVTETQAIQTIEFLETGTQLIFRPFIGNDGYIRVELHPEDSVGFINAQGLPSEQTTEITTNVIIRDGQTILIGGLFREVTTSLRSQVAGLGSLPLIGPLFRSQNDSIAREEVIILLTIHIVKDQDLYADASRRQLEIAEQLRVGARRGLMGLGRERLVQRYYRKAIEAVQNGDPKKAWCHTRMALHNDSTFLPVLRLQEKILGERAWEENGAGGRDFIYRLIAQERGYRLPLYGRTVQPMIEEDEQGR